MDFNVYPPQPWTKLLPDASDAACDLVSQLVCYESSSRLTAAEACSFGHVMLLASLMPLPRLDHIDFSYSQSDALELVIVDFVVKHEAHRCSIYARKHTYHSGIR